MSRPSDSDIIAALQKWGNRTTTSVARSVLAQQFPNEIVSQQWVLNQLKRLERAGKVLIVENRIWKSQYVWHAA